MINFFIFRDHPAFLYFRDRILITVTTIIIFAVFGEKIFVFCLGIDGEFYSFTSQHFWLNWISQGRWAMGLMVKLFPPFSAMPIFAPALFCAGLVTAGMMLAPLLAENRRQAILFIGLFVANPLWAHIIQFDTLSWGIGVGLVCVTWSLWLLHDGKYVLAALFLTFATGIYQSFLFLFVAAAIPLCISNPGFWRSPASRVSWRMALGVIVSAAAFNTAVAKLALILTHQKLTYITGYLHSEILSFPFISFVVFNRVLHFSGSLFLGTNSTYLGWGAAVLLPLWIGVGIGIVRLWQSGKGGNRATGFASVLALGATLFLPLYFTANSLPLRALVMVPYLQALLAFNAFRAARFAPAQWCLWGYGLAVSAWICTALSYSNEIAFRRDVIMGTRLMSRIEAVGRPAFGSRLPIALVGHWTHQNEGMAYRVEMAGDSFFEHDDGNVFRVRDFLKYLGLQGVVGVPLAHVWNEKAAITAMPSWPAENSVAVVGDVIVVKLGDITPD